VTPIELYFSVIVEAPYNQKDKLYDIIVNDINFEPLITPFKSFNLVLVSESEN
jgi:hypothetical protein